MSWEIEEEEARRTLALPAADRAVLFFQLVADWEQAWGLKDAAGWIIARESNALPLWPHAVFAEACVRGSWEGAAAEAIPLGELLDALLPLLAEDGVEI